MDSKELRILYLKQKIKELKNELCILCDNDYYNQCDLIEQYKMELEDLESQV